MKKSKSYFLGLSLVILLTIAVMYWAVKDNTQQLLSVITDASLGYVGLSILLVLLTHFLTGCTTVNLLRIKHRNFRYIDGFKSRILEQFSRGVSPYQTGGQAMQAYALNKLGIPLEDAIFALSVQFVIYQFASITICILIILSFLGEFKSDSIVFYGVIGGTIINSLIFVMLLIVVTSKRIHHFICHNLIKLLYKVRLVKDLDKTKTSINQKIESVQTQMKFLGQQKKLFFTNLMIEIVNYLVLNSVIYFIAKAFHVPLGIGDLASFTALSIFINTFSAFNPIPGASIGSEAVFLHIMGTRITSQIITKSMMITWRFSTYFIFIIIGAIYFIIFQAQLKKGKKYGNIK